MSITPKAAVAPKRTPEGRIRGGGQRSPELAQVFRALGDPTRLAIFEVIRANADPAEGHRPEEIARSISQIAAGFDLTLSTVSHHIKELRRAGLVQCERRGQSFHCSVREDTLAELGSFLAQRR